MGGQVLLQGIINGFCLGGTYILIGLGADAHTQHHEHTAVRSRRDIHAGSLRGLLFLRDERRSSLSCDPVQHVRDGPHRARR